MESEKNIYNPRYEVFLASRAIHRAVFVVPQLHQELVQQMKFDDFQVCVRKIIYFRLVFWSTSGQPHCVVVFVFGVFPGGGGGVQ